MSFIPEPGCRRRNIRFPAAPAGDLCAGRPAIGLEVLGGTAASHYGGRRLQDSRRRRALGALRSGCLLPGPIGQHLRTNFSRGQELNEIQLIMKLTLGGFGQRLIRKVLSINKLLGTDN